VRLDIFGDTLQSPGWQAAPLPYFAIELVQLADPLSSASRTGPAARKWCQRAAIGMLILECLHFYLVEAPAH
jgi:hypothetical protein